MKKAPVLVSASVIAALLAGVLAGAGGSAGRAAAQAYRLHATMTAKQVTTPRPPVGSVSSARGSLAGTATVGKPSTISWTLSFSGLTGPVKVAEVRYRSGPTTQIIRLCAPCKNDARLRTTFPSKAVATVFVKQTLAGKTDVVLKTKRNPGGEVRGILKAPAA